MGMRSLLRWWKRTPCTHDNGWRIVDDERHDVLVRECADNCGETRTIRQSSPERWPRA